MKTVIGQLNNGNGGTALMIFVIGLLISIGIFLLIRSILLWYWKIDTIVENQNKQLKEQQKMTNLIEQLVHRNTQ